MLEQVRPYLISDGGNIRVVGVEPSSLSVLVELEGACGSCPSSTTTMQMGVERVILMTSFRNSTNAHASSMCMHVWNGSRLSVFLFYYFSCTSFLVPRGGLFDELLFCGDMVGAARGLARLGGSGQLPGA